MDTYQIYHLDGISDDLDVWQVLENLPILSPVEPDRVKIVTFVRLRSIFQNVFCKAKNSDSSFLLDITYKTIVPEVTRKLETPILHCHGADDMMLSIKRAKMTSKILSSIVQQYDFQLVPDMGHEYSQEEMRIIQKFLVNQLPPKSTI